MEQLHGRDWRCLRVLGEYGFLHGLFLRVSGSCCFFIRTGIQIPSRDFIALVFIVHWPDGRIMIPLHYVLPIRRQ